MSSAFRCEVCAEDPLWRLLRSGDAAVTWACGDHLSQVCDQLQRDWEVTEVTVVSYAKSIEWAQIAKSLAAVEGGAS